MKPVNQYITVTTPGSKKISVCSRRIGSRDRMTVIAMANDETIAERIVDALNMLQGELTKLELPIQRRLDDVLATLSAQMARTAEKDTKHRNEVRELEKKLQTTEYQLRGVSRDLADTTDKFNKATAYKQQA